MSRGGVGTRVLHVTDAYLPRLGGIELHVRDLSCQQRAMGDSVDVLTLTTAPGACLPGPGTAAVVRPPASGVMGKARFIGDISALVRPESHDVVHVHCSTVSPLAFTSLAVVAKKIPTVVTVHSLWRGYTSAYRAADRAVAWSRWPVTWSAVSRAAADSVVRSAVRPLSVAVVPNGIDLNAWQPTTSTARPGRLRVISVMRLAARKRPLPLLRMLRTVHQELPSGTALEATIVGDGPLRPAMERFVQRNGMGNVIRLAGQLDRHQIAELMRGSDVFVAPATLESFGIAALEARAAGLPVIGRRRTGLADFVRVPRDGALVGSDSEMADVLLAAFGQWPFSPTGTETLQDMGWPTVLTRTAELYRAAHRRFGGE